MSREYYNFLLALAVLVRVALVIYGDWQDSKVGLHYTDIDYHVFSDAADFIAKGESPYERPTYRYSPLLAYLLIGNKKFGKNFGKWLFVGFDLLTGMLIRRLLRPDKRWTSFILWDLNPFVINISTRGNSDSITAFMLIVIIYMLQRNKIVIAAFWYGLAVHMRIFPVFLGLTFMFKLKTKVILFGAVAFAIFTVFNYSFYGSYGDAFLWETFVYHLVRSDYKHNFAAPWLSVYGGEDPKLFWGIARIVVIVMLSWYFRDDFKKAWASIVLCFIGFNTVCTVQYFDWALALIALIPDAVLNWRYAKFFAVWLLAHLGWLGVAYLLEFKGMNVYVPLWIMSVLVFIGNNALLYGLLKKDETKAKIE